MRDLVPEISDDEADLLRRCLALGGGRAERLWAMVNAMKAIDRAGLAGDVVECGVWRGASMIAARAVCRDPDRQFWLFDTFSGMPPPGKQDQKYSGPSAIDRYRKSHRWCYATLDEVKGHFTREGLMENTIFVPGMVEETLQQPELPERIALLRLDTDWYASTKVELEVLWPRLVQGGIMIIDDYGHWKGARQAVDEYFRGMVHLIRIDYSARMVVK